MLHDISSLTIDLVDFQSIRDGDFKYILHVQYHFTKYSVLRPMKSKTAEETAFLLMEILFDFGPVVVIQSDNGREFVNKVKMPKLMSINVYQLQVIRELSEMWSGGPIQCKLVNGRPLHPQSQGAVERANQDICNMLATWMREFKT